MRERVCGNNLNILSMCAVSPLVHTSNISSCQRKSFSFPVAVNNSTNIMKRPVCVLQVPDDSGSNSSMDYTTAAVSPWKLCPAAGTR